MNELLLAYPVDTQKNNNRFKHIKFVARDASSYHDLIFVLDVL